METVPMGVRFYTGGSLTSPDGMDRKYSFSHFLGCSVGQNPVRDGPEWLRWYKAPEHMNIRVQSCKAGFCA